MSHPNRYLKSNILQSRAKDQQNIDFLSYTRVLSHMQCGHSKLDIHFISICFKTSRALDD